MFSDAAETSTGYRQPVQARAFGRVAVVVAALLVLLPLGIRLTPPPMAAIDAGQTATFVTVSIPLDRVEERPLPAPANLAPPVAPAPPSAALPSPAAPGETAAPPASVTPPGTSIVTSPPAMAASAASGAAIPAPPAPAAPAAAAVPAAASASAAADWRARLLGHLKHFRRYPRQAEAARQQGIARVAITLRRSGDVVTAELVRGSGYPLLNMEARATVRRASPLPPPDDAIPGDPVTVEVPIDFALRR